MRINFFLTDFCKVAFVCKYYLKSFLCSALLPAPSSFYLPANAQTVGAGARRTRYDITFDRVIVTWRISWPGKTWLTKSKKIFVVSISVQGDDPCVRRLRSVDFQYSDFLLKKNCMEESTLHKLFMRRHLMARVQNIPWCVNWRWRVLQSTEKEYIEIEKSLITLSAAAIPHFKVNNREQYQSKQVYLISHIGNIFVRYILKVMLARRWWQNLGVTIPILFTCTSG